MITNRHAVRWRIATAAVGALTAAAVAQDIKPPEAAQQHAKPPLPAAKAAGALPNGPVIVKVKPDPLVIQQQQPWGGQLAQAPLTPAPEVVRLWAPETVASVRLSNHDLSAVAELDAKEFARREAASARLGLSSVPAEVIFAILARGELSVEQCERLLAIAQDKVLALPRGALGLRMQPSGDPRNPGVEVLLLLPGMPAERVLKIGDRIERIDDRPLATSSDLVEIVQSKMPGDHVRLSIARQQRDERGKPKLDPAGGFIDDRMEFDVALTTAVDLDRFEDQLASPVRSVVLERRLLALREAEARFSPRTVKIKSPPPAPIVPKKRPSDAGAARDPLTPDD